MFNVAVNTLIAVGFPESSQNSNHRSLAAIRPIKLVNPIFQLIRLKTLPFCTTILRLSLTTVTLSYQVQSLSKSGRASAFERHKTAYK
eukprot:g58261.t1